MVSRPEPEGVKLTSTMVSCVDPDGEKLAYDGDSKEAATTVTVTPTNSAPPSPVANRSPVVNVSGVASPPIIIDKEDPPEKETPKSSTPEEVRAAVEATKCPCPCAAPSSSSAVSSKSGPSPTPIKGDSNPDPSTDASSKERKPSELGPDDKQELPDGWKPSPNTVICGRGKDCFEAEGNKRFREVINNYLPEYTTATGKSAKSRIVSKALNIVREANPVGAFVKFEKGKWHEVSLRYAREKVGAWFRDCLSHRYKSSSKAKHARKMAARLSYENLVDPNAVFKFPKDFAAQIRDHERKSKTRKLSDVSEETKSQNKKAKVEKAKAQPPDPQALIFYDIDDLALIPFDSVDC